MIVCVCRRISDREIARHAHAGMDFDDIQFALGVATQCGRCETCARQLVAQCSAARTVAHIQNMTAPGLAAPACAPQESDTWTCASPSSVA